MVDEGFVTVGSITGSRIYGCSSESGGEVLVTGWWQQVVNATGWVAQFLKEITTLWPPCVADANIIFLPRGFYLSSISFSSPNLSGRRLDVYHTSTHGVALVRI